MTHKGKEHHWATFRVCRLTELNEVAARVQALAGKASVIHVVANNHAQDFAPKAALALKRVLDFGNVVGTSRPEDPVAYP